jgi:enoyl-CoA hydratase
MRRALERVRDADDRGGPMSDYESVLYEVDDRVATVRLNRPEQRNALNFTLRQDIVATLRRAEADGDVSLVLLEGAGPSFCAGYDLKIPDFTEAQKQHTCWVGDPRLEHWTDQFARGSVRDWMNLWDVLKPVVVQVHGNCLAGGLELMSMADIAFVADDSPPRLPAAGSPPPTCRSSLGR